MSQKPNAAANLTAPREKDEIEKEHGKLLIELAQTEYLIFVKSEDKAKLLKQVQNLNFEYSARKELDKAFEEKQKADSNEANKT